MGVILNLAVWFAVHTIWREVIQWQAGPITLNLPVPGSIDWAAAALAVLALLAVFRLKLGMALTLGGAAGLGIALHVAGLA